MNESEVRPAALVLVVEDEPVQRLALVDLIEDAGFGVIEAWDSDSAIAILASRTDIRLVITDIDMPGEMDGLKLAAAVRGRWPPIEIILVSSGRPPRADELPARAEFLSKPIRTDRLIEGLRRLAG